MYDLAIGAAFVEKKPHKEDCVEDGADVGANPPGTRECLYSVGCVVVKRIGEKYEEKECNSCPHCCKHLTGDEHVVDILKVEVTLLHLGVEEIEQKGVHCIVDRLHTSWLIELIFPL